VDNLEKRLEEGNPGYLRRNSTSCILISKRRRNHQLQSCAEGSLLLIIDNHTKHSKHILEAEVKREKKKDNDNQSKHTSLSKWSHGKAQRDFVTVIRCFWPRH